MRAGELPPRWWGGVFLVALLLRIAYAGWLGSGNLYLSSDAQAYHSIAVNLLSRHEFVTTIDPPHSTTIPYAVRPPLTPFLLAAAYGVAGESPRVAQGTMALVGAAGCALVAVLAAELFGVSVGVTAGLLAAADPFLVFLASMPLTENLALLLYVWLAILLVRLAAGSRLREAIGAGVVFGLGALNKPALLGALPLLIGWMLVAGRHDARRTLTLAAVFVAAAAVTIGPWTLRNYARFGAIVPVTVQSGAVMYQANGFHADYAIDRLEHGATGWYNAASSPSSLDETRPVESDRRQGRVAIEFIRTHPGKFAEQALRKTRIFWGAYPSSIHRVSWGLIAAFSLAGIYMTRRSWRRLMPLYILIVQTATIPVLFTSMPRFRAPVEPFLLMLAAVPLASLWTQAAVYRRA
jgi:4-amino-4-deoxy-L-arabinose transferase-like glycosyltransferase